MILIILKQIYLTHRYISLGITTPGLNEASIKETLGVIPTYESSSLVTVSGYPYISSYFRRQSLTRQISDANISNQWLFYIWHAVSLFSAVPTKIWVLFAKNANKKKTYTKNPTILY